mgnify:CR=1 FL=1
MLSFPTGEIPFISREEETEIERSGDAERIAKLEEHNKNLHIRARLYSALDSIKIFADDHLGEEEKGYFMNAADSIIAEYNKEVEEAKETMQEQGLKEIRMPLVHTELVTRTHELLRELRDKLIEKGLM